MRIKVLVVPVLLGAIFLSSCKRKSITLDSTNAKGEVPQLGNLYFRFSSSLATDSMLNAWDSTEYISFHPNIPGRFRWEQPDQLVFSPAEPLAPATTYTAKIKNKLLKYSEYNSITGDDKITFHTAPLTLDNTQVLWVLQDEGSQAAVPQVDMLFNYRIAPSTLKSKMEIQVDGVEMDYDMITASPDNKISARIKGLKAEDKDRELKIIIDKGLKPESGRNSTEDEIVSSSTIPSPFVLSIQNLEAEHDGTEGLVRVTTSQQLTNENFRNRLHFEPQLNFTTEQTENGFIIRSDKFDVERSYALTIDKGLRGKIGGVLKEDYSGNVAFGELEANINFTNNKGVYLSKKGGRNLEIQITNVPKVKLIVSKIYENNLLMAQRYGYYPQEPRATRASYGDDYYEGDYYDYSSSETLLGDVVYEKEIDTRSLPKSGAGRILNFSQFEDRLPDFKGIYHVVIRSSSDYWVKDSRFISVSDLGLVAKEGLNKIFVFVNSIKTARSVDNVNIAVYSANNQLIGTGATNKEGVAEINYAKKEFSGFSPAMLIAKTDDDFNYLPFNNTRVNTSRFDIGGKRTNPSGLDAFVYAERGIL